MMAAAMPLLNNRIMCQLADSLDPAPYHTSGMVLFTKASSGQSRSCSACNAMKLSSQRKLMVLHQHFQQGLIGFVQIPSFAGDALLCIDFMMMAKRRTMGEYRDRFARWCVLPVLMLMITGNRSLYQCQQQVWLVR
jgi:hypothetical protein